MKEILRRGVVRDDKRRQFFTRGDVHLTRKFKIRGLPGVDKSEVCRTRGMGRPLVGRQKKGKEDGDDHH